MSELQLLRKYSVVNVADITILSAPGVEWKEENICWLVLLLVAIWTTTSITHQFSNLQLSQKPKVEAGDDIQLYLNVI